MKKYDDFKKFINILESAVMILLQTITFSVYWFERYAKLNIPFWNWAIIAFYALFLFMFSKAFGGFKVGHSRMFDVLLTQILSMVCTNILIILQIALINRWWFKTDIIIEMAGVEFILIVLWSFIARWIYRRFFPPHQMLLVWSRKEPEYLESKLSSRPDKYVVRETIHTGAGLDTVTEKINAYPAVVLFDIPTHERNVLLKYCFENAIRVYLTPSISDILVMGTEKIHLFDTPILLARNIGLTFEQRLAKRFMDIAISLIGIIAASPFMMLIALCVKLYDDGPVFYRQERLTKDGNTFIVLKFRSMHIDSEKQGARLAMKDDDRITPFGRLIRNIHFDELPQLFNVLKGDMSFIGPRPERRCIAAEYKKAMPEFDYRLKVKAGLTGYAQVYGKYNTTPYDKLRLDLFYIQNYSFILDLKLIFLTVKILFRKEKAEGVEPWQKTATPDNNLKKESKMKDKK